MFFPWLYFETGFIRLNNLSQYELLKWCMIPGTHDTILKIYILDPLNLIIIFQWFEGKFTDKNNFENPGMLKNDLEYYGSYKYLYMWFYYYIT